jgi:hypothetical protein
MMFQSSGPEMAKNLYQWREIISYDVKERSYLLRWSGGEEALSKAQEFEEDLARSDYPNYLHDWWSNQTDLSNRPSKYEPDKGKTKKRKASKAPRAEPNLTKVRTPLPWWGAEPNLSPLNNPNNPVLPSVLRRVGEQWGNICFVLLALASQL